ncbi:MAG TPA: TonB-dependent receptor [Permianibacter sp.]|nr:TonB-dependent receptor [Permianibacter sp.]
MSTQRNNPIAKAIRFALIGGAAIAAATPAFAADEAAGEEEQRIEVTGSRIKRTDVEGPQPITVISAEDIKATGDQSVAEVLRNSTFNSFGSFRESSGSAGGGQSQATFDMRGLGSNRTLVLVNGRRTAYSPGLDGASTNLNTIPFAAVERIEILRDGASAVYGSDAIAGVVNIILRKDFEGMELTYSNTNPEEDGGAEKSLSVVGGIASEKGNMVFSYETYTKDIISYKDRDYWYPDVSTQEAADYQFAIGNLSPTGFPGSYIPLAGPDAFTAFAHPLCPTTFGSDPNFPDSGIVNDGTDQYCGYRFSSVAGQTASLDRHLLSVYGNYEITDSINAFFRASASNVESFGVFAPTPASPAPIVPAGATFNPTYGQAGSPDINGDGTPDGYAVQGLVRLVPAGTRDSYVYDLEQNYTLGVDGSTDKFEWQVAVSKMLFKQDSFGYNYINKAILQNLINSGINPFSVAGINTLSQRSVTTITVDNFYDANGIDGNISMDLFELPGGTSSLVVGAERREEKFGIRADQQANLNNIIGTAGGNSSGDRDISATYVEIGLPILDMLEANVAIRRDDYGEYGAKTSPGIGLAFRPLDNLLFRASFGEGFRAPGLSDLFRINNQSFNAATDTLRCETVNVCSNRQRETYINGNPNLESESSDQLSFGVVWQPMDDLSLSFDAWEIDVEDGIRNLTTQEVLDAEYACSIGQTSFCDATRWGSVDRTVNFAAPVVYRFAVNAVSIETRGYDFDLKYKFGTPVGDFRVDFQVSVYDEYLIDDIEYVDSVAVPDTRANLFIGWNFGDFAATLANNYIGGYQDCSATSIELDTCDNPDISSFTTHDLVFNYETPWNASLSVGVRNLTAEEPVILQSTGDVDGIQEISGRVPFFSYTQRF